MTTRKELVGALRTRYCSAAPGDKVKILDEFVALTGYHRKHAIRALREGHPAKEAQARICLYDEAVRQALTLLWEAADRVCDKRLKALIPLLVDTMERQGHLDLDPVIKTKVLQVSAATIDRVLAYARSHVYPVEVRVLAHIRRGCQDFRKAALARRSQRGGQDGPVFSLCAQPVLSGALLQRPHHSFIDASDKQVRHFGLLVPD